MDMNVYSRSISILMYNIVQKVHDLSSRIDLAGVYSYLDRLLSRVICGNLVTTNRNLVQNVVQTWQFESTIEYNQPTQNNVESGLILFTSYGTVAYINDIQETKVRHQSKWS